MGMAARGATLDEKKRMSRTLEECMEAGCIGLSTGLQYMPGLQSDTLELVHLGRVLKKYNGMYVSHLRTYMNALDKAVNDAERNIALLEGRLKAINERLPSDKHISRLLAAVIDHRQIKLSEKTKQK